nr:MAG TPA: hypothetical protein [Caudoviricetes sp.]
MVCLPEGFLLDGNSDRFKLRTHPLYKAYSNIFYNHFCTISIALSGYVFSNSTHVKSNPLLSLPPIFKLLF